MILGADRGGQDFYLLEFNIIGSFSAMSMKSSRLGTVSDTASLRFTHAAAPIYIKCAGTQ